MADLDAFEAEVRKNIKLLSSDDARVRRKAAAWLGEAGEPSAITRLRQVYKEDSDRSVREAAEYSLGMFRALERALDSDASEAVMDQLQDIAVNNQFGRRSRFRAANLYRLVLGLIVSLAMLLVFTFVLWPQLEPQLGSLGIGGSASPLLDDVSSYVADLRADATTLQQQYQAVLGGGQVNCEVTFNNPSPFSEADATGEIASLIERANTTLTSLNDAKTAFVQACPPNSTPLTMAEIGTPLSKLTPVLQSLSEIEVALVSAGGSSSSVNTTVSPTVPAETTIEPSAIPVSPTPSYDVTPHVDALNAIVTRMEGTGGANVVLKQYWADVRTSGSTGGCGQARPTIPENYALPDAEVAQAPEALTLGVSLVNTGLELVRRGWDQFSQACTANNLGAALETGARTSDAATSAFNNAKTALAEAAS